MDGCNVNHRDADRDDGIHTPISFVYATEADRIAAVSYPVGDLTKVFAANDVTKFCYVEDTQKVYILVDYSPVLWEVTARTEFTDVLELAKGSIDLVIADTLTENNQLLPLSVGGFDTTRLTLSSGDLSAQGAIFGANALVVVGNDPDAGNYRSELVFARILNFTTTANSGRLTYTINFLSPAEGGRNIIPDALTPDPSWGIDGQLVRMIFYSNATYIIHNRSSETLATTTADGLMSSGDKVRLDNAISGVDLDIVRSPSSFTITNDGGADVVVPSATEAFAGALSSTDKATLDDLANATLADQAYLSSTVFEKDLRIVTTISAPDQIRFESGNNVTELQISLSVSEASNIQDGLEYVIVFKGLGEANYGFEEAIAITHHETSISSSDDIFDDNAYRILTIPLDRPLANPFNNQTPLNPASFGALGQDVRVQLGPRRDALAYNPDSNRLGDTRRAGLLSTENAELIRRNDVQVFREYVEHSNLAVEDFSPSDTERVIRISDLTKDHIVNAPATNFTRILLPNSFPYMGLERTLTFSIQNATTAIVRVDNTTPGVDFERLEESRLYLKPTEVRVFQVRLDGGALIYTPLGDVFYEARFRSTTTSVIGSTESFVPDLVVTFETNDANSEIFSISTDSSGSFDAGDGIVPLIGGQVTFPFIGHDHSVDAVDASAPLVLPEIVMSLRNYRRAPVQTSFKVVGETNITLLRGSRLALSSSSSNLFFSGYRALSGETFRFTTQTVDSGFTKTLRRLEGTIRLNPLNIAPLI